MQTGSAHLIKAIPFLKIQAISPKHLFHHPQSPKIVTHQTLIPVFTSQHSQNNQVPKPMPKPDSPVAEPSTSGSDESSSSSDLSPDTVDRAKAAPVDDSLYLQDMMSTYDIRGMAEWSWEENGKNEMYTSSAPNLTLPDQVFSSDSETSDDESPHHEGSGKDGSVNVPTWAMEIASELKHMNDVQYRNQPIVFPHSPVPVRQKSR